MSVYWLLFWRDVRLAWLRPADSLLPVLFLMLVVLMFPLALGASERLLQRVAPGVLWVAILLSVMMSLERLFRDDISYGVITQWWTRRGSLLSYVFVRLVTTHLIVLLPLLVGLPLFGAALGLSWQAMPTLMVSLLFGGSVLLNIGAVGSALTATLPRANVLLALIVLPFYLPILIFAASAVSVAQEGFAALGQLYVLAGVAVLAWGLSPLAITAALRMRLRS